MLKLYSKYSQNSLKVLKTINNHSKQSENMLKILKHELKYPQFTTKFRTEPNQARLATVLSHRVAAGSPNWLLGYCYCFVVCTVLRHPVFHGMSQNGKNGPK